MVRCIMSAHCPNYTMHWRFKNPSRIFGVSKSALLNKKVRLAERSKAPDLSSGTRMSAWVRTPHLTNIFISFFTFFLIYKISEVILLSVCDLESWEWLENWKELLLSFIHVLIMQLVIFKSWCTQNYMLLYFLGNKYCLYLCSNIRFKNASVFMQLTRF